MRTITIEKKDGHTESIEMYVKKKGKHTKHYYTTYAGETDMTFIMKDILHSESTEIISTECVGWHFGEPDENTFVYYIENPSVKAEYETYANLKENLI